MVEDGDYFVDGVGIWLDTDLVGEVLADGSDGDVFLDGCFVDDLHADTENGLGPSPH